MATQMVFKRNPLRGIPPGICAMRVRFEGGQGRGRIDLEFCNWRDVSVAPGVPLDRPRLEEVAQRLLDTHRPGWASGRTARGSILIDLATGETRMEDEAAG